MTSQAFSLQGKTILVNGMASGVGLAITQACEQRGADILTTSQPGRQLHGLVHCVDQQLACPVSDLSKSDLMQVLQANLIGPIMLTQRLLQAESLVPNSSIVFLLSSAAHQGAKGQGAYAASKAALSGLIRCLALEQAANGIRVNGISPAAHESLWPDVANGVIFLLSDASRWITGTSLPVNGAGTELAS